MTGAAAVLVANNEAVNAAPGASSLGEIQNAFQAALMAGDDAILDSILDNSRTDRGVLFGVYRHAYVSRLVDIIRSDHPLLNRFLGDDGLEELARAYVAARPSRNPNARWFSQGLPEFAAETRSENPEIAELAALERMVNNAFVASDGPVLQLSELASVAPEDWAKLTFSPHTSMQRATIRTNAHALWASLKNGEDPPSVSTLEEPHLIIAWRRDVTPVLRRMDGEEAMMWNEACNGVPFGALCELVAIYDDPGSAAMRSARYLQGWISSGMLGQANLAL